jgi:hypothetical protein
MITAKALGGLLASMDAGTVLSRCCVCSSARAPNRCTSSRTVESSMGMLILRASRAALS